MIFLELKEKLSEFIDLETKKYYCERYKTILNGVRSGEFDRDAISAAWEHKFNQVFIAISVF